MADDTTSLTKKPVLISKSVLFCAGIAVIMAVWLWCGVLPSIFYQQVDQAGQFGDSFGLATSLFSSFGFIIGMVALIMQIVESKELGNRQEKQEQLQTRQITLAEETARLQRMLQESEISTLVMKCIVALISDISRLREAWIDISFHSDSTEQRNAKARFESAIESLKGSSFTASMLFKHGGRELTRLIDELLNLTRDTSQPATLTGARVSSLTVWFDVTFQEIKSLTQEVWRVQPGVAVTDIHTGVREATPKLVFLNNVVRLANQLRKQTVKCVDDYYTKTQHAEESEPEHQIREHCLSKVQPLAAELIAYCENAAPPTLNLDFGIASPLKWWAGIPEDFFGATVLEVPYREVCQSIVDRNFESTLDYCRGLMEEVD